jgi:ABC-type phosphate transport system substrate-binding protein
VVWLRQSRASKCVVFAPKPENAEKYPLSRKLYYYTIEGKVSEEGKKFLAWATTDKKAGEVVTKVGFIPAK